MREKLIELLTEPTPIVDSILGDECAPKMKMGLIFAEKVADRLLANDVVPVVRCKDCKHYDNTEGIQWCSLNSKFAKWGTDWHSFPEDGFCSYGERRADERKID